MLSVLGTDSPPDVILFRCETKLPLEQNLEAVCPLRQNLVGVPVCSRHHASNRDYVIIWHVLVEKVTHRVDENHPRSTPAKRVAKFLRNNPQIEAKLEGMAGHATKSLGESLGVAMHTAGADLGASSN